MSRANDPRRREDGVCLAARHAAPVAHVTAAAGVARLIPRCWSSARSWLRDSWHVSNAGCSRSWHQSHCIQAAIPKAKGPRRREDGVCLAARHALLLTSRPRHGRLALPVCFRSADRVLVLGSVTFVTLRTPHGVARGIRATECEHRFPRRRPQSCVLTAFASLLGTRRRGPHGFRRLAVAARLILRCRSSARSWLRDLRDAPYAA